MQFEFFAQPILHFLHLILSEHYFEHCGDDSGEIRNVWHRRTQSGNDSQLRIALLLGLAALFSNSLQAAFADELRSPNIGNLFIFFAVISNGVLGGCTALAAGIIPFTFWSGDHLYTLRMIVLCVSVGILYQRFPRISPTWIVLGTWALLFGPILMGLSTNQLIPERWDLASVLAYTLRDLVLIAFAEMVLLDPTTWQLFSNEPRPAKVEPIIRSIVTFVSVISFSLAYEFLLNPVHPEGMLVPTNDGGLIIFAVGLPLALFGMSFGSLLIARYFKQEGRNILMGEPLPSSLSKTFSGQASDYWRRVQTAQTPTPPAKSVMGAKSADDSPSPKPQPIRTDRAEKNIEGEKVALCALNRDGTVVFINPRFRELAHIKQNEVVGRDFRAIGMLPNIQTHIGQLLEQTFRDGPSTTELRINQLPSKLEFIEFSSMLPEHEDQDGDASSSIIITARDVTSKRTLQQHQILDQKLAALGSLAENLTHAYANSLTAISAGLSCVEHSTSPEQSRAAMTEVHARVAETSALVRQLLSFATSPPAKYQPHALGPLVKERLPLFSLAVGLQNKIELISCEEESNVECDLTLLFQAIMSLLIHARDTSNGDSSQPISLAIQRETLPKEVVQVQPDAYPGEFVRIRVRSHGHGTTPGELSRLLNPQLAGHGNRSQGARGLSAVYSIVKAHDGFLTAESHPEKGSTISMYLPFVTTTTPAVGADTSMRATKRAELPKGNQEHILLVENDDSIRRALSSMLTFLGYRVGSCDSPRTALEQCKQGGVDLILVDALFPELKSLGALEELKDMYPRLKRLVMTDSTLPDLSESDFSVIAKPFDLETLALSVRATLDRQRAEEANPHS